MSLSMCGKGVGQSSFSVFTPVRSVWMPSLNQRCESGYQVPVVLPATLSLANWPLMNSLLGRAFWAA